MIQQSDDLLTEVLDGEAVVLRLTDHTLHRLDPVATQVWLALGEPQTQDDLARRLAAQFEVPEERVAADLVPLLDHLADVGLVRRLEG